MRLLLQDLDVDQNIEPMSDKTKQRKYLFEVEFETSSGYELRTIREAKNQRGAKNSFRMEWPKSEAKILSVQKIKRKPSK